MKKFSSLFLFCTMFLCSFAQDTSAGGQPADDFMNSNGKIYVVVAVIVVIIAGLFLYLFSLDRKLSKMEKEHNKLR